MTGAPVITAAADNWSGATGSQTLTINPLFTFTGTDIGDLAGTCVISYACAPSISGASTYCVSNIPFTGTSFPSRPADYISISGTTITL